MSITGLTFDSTLGRGHILLRLPCTITDMNYGNTHLITALGLKE